MKLFRVVDYDYPEPEIVVIDFIDFSEDKIGIIAFTEAEYSGPLPIREGEFDIEKIDKIKSQKANIYINFNHYDEFHSDLSNWWREQFYAKQLQPQKPDELLMKALEKDSSRIIKSIL